MPSYQETHLRSLRDPEGFWAEAAQGLHWFRTWDRVLDDPAILDEIAAAFTASEIMETHATPT